MTTTKTALKRGNMLATFQTVGPDMVRVTHYLNGRVSGVETTTRDEARAEYRMLRDEGGFAPAR